MRYLAVIGTAGRDKERPMTRELWDAMLTDLEPRVATDDVLVSGGAAWADHLAVRAYLNGWCIGLELYLPAPFNGHEFLGPARSAASAGNYYHGRFSAVIGCDSLREIGQAVFKGAIVTSESSAIGYGGMFARNKRVAARATAVLGYTFGEGDTPADGGTLNTWEQIGGADKTHVSLLTLANEQEHAVSAPPPGGRRPNFG